MPFRAKTPRPAPISDLVVVMMRDCARSTGRVNPDGRVVAVAAVGVGLSSGLDEAEAAVQVVPAVLALALIGAGAGPVARAGVAAGEGCAGVVSPTKPAKQDADLRGLLGLGAREGVDGSAVVPGNEDGLRSQ